MYCLKKLIGRRKISNGKKYQPKVKKQIGDKIEGNVKMCKIGG